MAEPTLTDVFGAGASQTLTTLTITKADLTGLTADANNRAEQLFVAIVLKALAYFTQANQDANPDQQIVIAEGFPFQSLVSRNNQQFRQITYSVNLQKPDTASTIDPDEF